MPFNNTQPSLVLTRAITLVGIFPSQGGGGGEIPMATIRYFAGNFAPNGSATATGQQLSIAQNQALFSILGTQYGGNGQTTFALPNLGGRVSVGYDGSNTFPGSVYGQTNFSLTQQNLPSSSGGFSVALDSEQPTLATTFLIRVSGVFPARPAPDGGEYAPTGDDLDPQAAGSYLLASITEFAGNFAPSGYMFANGQLLNISQNTALFSLLGTTYGGNGVTTFALPDLRGRTIVGDSDALSLGQVLGGDPSITLANMPVNMGGQGLAVDNHQPSLVLNYIISLYGVFPSQSGGGGFQSDAAVIGEVVPFAGNFAPSGFAFCDGSLLSINGNEALFQLIGTTYGGNGQTTFALPDLRGRSIVGSGNGFNIGEMIGSDGFTITMADIPALNFSGDGGDNALYGGNLNDVINGAGGNDSITGNNGADNLSGGDGSDILRGGDGDDLMAGGLGADTLGGGAGTDTADYSASNAGVTVNLESGLGTGGHAQGDAYASVERVVGSIFNDTLIGRDYFDDVLDGGEGNDTLNGNVGADTLLGGNGVDTLDYANSFNGIDVRLFDGSAAGGSANGDTYSGMENIRGSDNFTDTLAGDAGANSIWGGGGNETITGREGNDLLFGDNGNDALLGGAGEDTLSGGAGADTIGGGADDDTVDYSASNAGVTVNLATGAGLGGHAQGDTLVSIEDVIGSAFDDVIIGKANFWDNVFDGAGGNDTITGGNGNDVFVFRLGDGSDTVTDFGTTGGAGFNDVIRMVGWGAGFDTVSEMLAVATQNGANVVFNFGNGQTLTLNNVTLGNLNAGDFLFA